MIFCTRLLNVQCSPQLNLPAYNQYAIVVSLKEIYIFILFIIFIIYKQLTLKDKFIQVTRMPKISPVPCAENHLHKAVP